MTARDYEIDQPVWVAAYGRWYAGTVTAVVPPLVVVAFTTRRGAACHRTIDPERLVHGRPAVAPRTNRAPDATRPRGTGVAERRRVS